jgi:hypothetical protein
MPSNTGGPIYADGDVRIIRTMHDLNPRLSRDRERLRQRTLAFMKLKRPILKGQRWEQWARELVALVDAKAWNSFGGPAHPRERHMSQAQLLRSLQVTDKHVELYRTALRVLDAMSAAGMDRSYADLLPVKLVAQFGPLTHDPELMRDAARAAARSSQDLRAVINTVQRQKAGKPTGGGKRGHKRWWDAKRASGGRNVEVAQDGSAGQAE